MTTALYIILIIACHLSVTYETINKGFVEASNEFAIRLYKHLASEDGNIFFCPVCLTSSLTLLMEGAKFKTETELNATLNYKTNKLNKADVRNIFKNINQRIKETDCLSESITALFVQSNQSDLTTNFRQQFEDIYNTQVHEVDFVGNRQQTLWEINELVKLSTKGHIRRLLDRIDNKSQLLLVNAFHYSTKFPGIFGDQRQRKQRFFNHGVSDHQLLVNMMSKRKGNYRISNSYDFRALELPCGDINSRNTTLWLFLPHKTGALSAVEDGLSAATFEEVRNSLQPAEIEISIPKIRFNYFKDISKELQLMGIRRAFSSDEANFQTIYPSEKIALTHVLLKSIGEITEPRIHYQSWNTSWSSVETPAGLNVPSDQAEPFIADHPFLLSVVDEITGLILYLGRVFEF